MKNKILAIILTMSSVAAYAGSNLYPGTYTDKYEMGKIFEGNFDNLLDRTCPIQALNKDSNRVNIAMGNTIVGIRVVPGSESGRAYYYITPEWKTQISYRADSSKCFVKDY